MYNRSRFYGVSLILKGPKREAVNAAYGAQDNQWLHAFASHYL